MCSAAICNTDRSGIVRILGSKDDDRGLREGCQASSQIEQIKWIAIPGGIQIAEVGRSEVGRKRKLKIE